VPVACRSRRSNAETLEAIARTLEAATDAAGTRLEVVRIPAPVNIAMRSARFTRVAYELHHRQRIVVMPVYGTPRKARRSRRCRPCFRAQVVGLPAQGVLGSGMIAAAPSTASLSRNLSR